MPLRLEILNTGSELLLGEVLNTHLSFIAQKLFPLGLRVQRQMCVPDGSAIRDALADSFSRCDIVIVTGGLGPTSDDLTRESTAALLNRKLLLDKRVLQAIDERLTRRGYTMNERIRKQAYVPEGAEVLWNPNGTAPGLAIKTENTPHLFLLPGPPRELHPMVVDHLIPRLRKLVNDLDIQECRVYRIAGIGESLVEEMVGTYLENVPGLELGYCANPGRVDLRLIGSRDVVESAEPFVLERLGDHIFSRDGSGLEEVVAGLLKKHHATLSVAESCTGGFIAHRLTNVPGVSEVFLAGAVTYSNAAKREMIGVPKDLLDAHGAVSEPVARAMVQGVLEKTGSDFALSTTGIAGPGGGTEEKPVGTVFIGIGSKEDATEVQHFRFDHDRETFKTMASQTALEMLRQRLLRFRGV